MKAIRTITLNPCFDLHNTIPHFSLGKEHSTSEVSVEAGGKGVNTSRALWVNGVENLAYIVIGNENGDSFVSLMRDYDRFCRYFRTDGRIRENITIHSDGGEETRISLDTFRVSSAVFAELEHSILSENLSALLVSFSGRLPQGLEKGDIKRLLKRLVAGGAKVVVDSASLTPDDLREIRPWFIKPNGQEIEAFLGRTPQTAREAADRAKELVRADVAETVMISLGGEDAAFSDGENTYVLRVPKLEHPASTVGAGDSTVAGLLAGVAREHPLEDSLRLAVAYGTAACMTSGTRPPRPEDIKTVFAQTRAERV